MRRILFVDDEPRILAGLRRLLRPQRHEWEMLFAEGGQAALDLLAEQPVDVLVTDMRMPGIDGAELLRQVNEQYPRTVRFVLSGHSELEAVMRVVPIAHQFLSKPCDAAVLREAVARACELQSLLSSPDFTRIVGEMDSLPSRPDTYAAVTRALTDPEVEIATVAEIIEADTGMSAKILQLVNSSFFGLPRSVDSVASATTFLGLNTIRDLVLSVEVFRPPEGISPLLEEFLAALQVRSRHTAMLARAMFEDKVEAARAFTSGMLHDVGSLVLASQMPERYAELLERARGDERPTWQVEEEVLGVSHAEVGAYLLGLWGLPYPILEAAAYHHRPSTLPQERMSDLTAVHVASALVQARLPECCFGKAGQIDLAYLQSLGLEERLPDWEALADQLLDVGEPEAGR